MSRPTSAAPSGSQAAESSAVVAMVRFLRLVRLHQRVMIISLAITCVLGGVYYASATRIYQAAGSIQVVENGMSVLERNQLQSRVKDYMPSYLSILRKPAVIQKVIDSMSAAQMAEFGNAPQEEWERILKSRIQVRNPLDTNILELYFRSPNPDNAATILDALIKSYIEFVHETHKGTSQEVLTKLTEERLILEKEIQQRTDQLIVLRATLEDFESGEEGRRINLVFDQLQRMSVQLTDAQHTTLEAHAKYLAIQSAIRNNEDIIQFALQNLDTLSTDLLKLEFNLDPGNVLVVSRLNEELIDKRAQKFAADRKFGENHPQVIELANDINLLQQQLAQHLAGQRRHAGKVRSTVLAPQLLQMASQQYGEAFAKEQSLQATVYQKKQEALGLNVRMAQVRQIESDLTRKNSRYDMLIDRMKDVELGKDSGTRIHILGHPTPPQTPVSPRLSFVVLGSIAGGIGVGFAVVYILSVLDDRFRTMDEMQSMLAAPVLTTVRRMETPQGKGGLSLITVAAPESVVAESYRTLRTGIIHQQHESTRLVVTSSEPGDGKTTSIGNLAAAFAQAGKRTLLIDADLRRPGLTKLLGLRSQNGLSKILESDEPIDVVVKQAIVSGTTDRLDVIPAGTRPANPAELLESDRFNKLLAWAETEYDQILIDAPPILAVTDATIIGRLVDAIVLVVRPEKNSRRLVVRASEVIASHGCKLLGLIVNHISKEKNERYVYEYDYGYHYTYTYGHDTPTEGNSKASPSSQPAASQLATQKRLPPKSTSAASSKQARPAPTKPAPVSKGATTPQPTPGMKAPQRPAATQSRSAPPANRPQTAARVPAQSQQPTAQPPRPTAQQPPAVPPGNQRAASQTPKPNPKATQPQPSPQPTPGKTTMRKRRPPQADDKAA